MVEPDQPTAPPATRCPSCGAAAERGQLVCLECGGRIAIVYRRPPSWKVPIAITVLVVAIVAALAATAFAAINDNAKHEVESRAKATSQLPTAGQYLAMRCAAAVTSGPGSTLTGAPPSSSASIVCTADAASASVS